MGQLFTQISSCSDLRTKPDSKMTEEQALIIETVAMNLETEALQRGYMQ
jgi:hypothetical protein